MRWVLTLFAVSIGYSVVRYVTFTPKNIENLPIFVINKGLSMGAALCFVAAFMQQWRKGRGRVVKTEPGLWFRSGVYAAIAHIPLSLAILRPGYFKEFFDGERLNFGGEAVFLFGALTAGAIYLQHRAGWSAVKRWVLSLFTVGLLFAHVLAMGICRGVHLDRTHAYLPPMWLLSLLAVAVGLFFVFASRPRDDAAPPQAFESR